MINFGKGDCVSPKDPRYPLHCGSGLYEKAICVSVDPFIMVSEHGDMMWVKEKAEDYEFHSHPTWVALHAALTRYVGDLPNPYID